jgi:DNA-binding MarR family transcriptional regulator
MAHSTSTDVILDSIRRIVRSLRGFSRGVEGQFGVSAAQLFILERLKDENLLSINDLADRSFTHQSTVSEIVAKLRKKRLVVQKESAEDRRKKLIGLSIIGKSLLGRAPITPQAKLVKGIQGLTKDEQLQLARLFKKMIEHSQLDHEPASLFFEDPS